MNVRYPWRHQHPITHHLHKNVSWMALQISNNSQSCCEKGVKTYVYFAAANSVLANGLFVVTRKCLWSPAPTMYTRSCKIRVLQYNWREGNEQQLIENKDIDSSTGAPGEEFGNLLGRRAWQEGLCNWKDTVCWQTMHCFLPRFSYLNSESLNLHDFLLHMFSAWWLFRDFIPASVLSIRKFDLTLNRGSW